MLQLDNIPADRNASTSTGVPASRRVFGLMRMLKVPLLIEYLVFLFYPTE